MGLREVDKFAQNHTTSQMSSCFVVVKGSEQIWSWTDLGANPNSVVSLLCDIRLVTQFLCISVSSSTKWGGE